MKCKCGNEEFYAHQVVRVMVTSLVIKERKAKMAVGKLMFMMLTNLMALTPVLNVVWR